MRLFPLITGVVVFLAAAVALAADPDADIRKSFKLIQPDMPIEAIAESPMAGVYQVQLQGGRLLYSSADGQFILQGNMYQVQDGKPVNLTERHESKAIGEMLAKVPTSEMVVFPAKNTKTHITVFTDTDCGYCQKLHSEVPELNRLGVEVRYMAFPRQGVGSHGYKTLVSVWCSKDPKEAMNQAKALKDVPAATCDNPVEKQYALGGAIGVNGTPAIVLANGQMIPGYKPAPELAKLALDAK